MRRFIAYILMALSILIGVGVAFTPVFTNMNPGREYTSGNEIVYRLSDRDDVIVDENGDAVNKVATEMRARLETYKIEDYSVKIEGNDTIRVGLSVKNDTILNYVAKYLSFSGGDFSLAGKEEETRLSHSEIFDGSQARIIHKENGLIPYVIFPLSPNNATAAASKVKDLIEKVTGESGGSDEKSAINPSPRRAAEGEEGGTEPNIFLWANWAEGDDYEKATSTDIAHTGEKIIAQFSSENIWYEDEKASKKDDDEEKEESTELQLLCGFAKDGDASQYDTNKLREANDLATYYCNMFNASKYDVTVENLFVSESASGVTMNPIRSDATIENLLVFGSDVNVKLSATLIATFIAIGVVFLLLILFYRVAALGLVANTLLSVFATYGLFIALGGTFNIAAIVGGVLVAAASIFIGVLYMTKFKEEVYKGRAVKKANAEAHKKILLPSIDLSVVSAFSGLMFYFIGGNALRPLGIMLFFGGLITLVLNLLVLRLLTWLLTNSTNMQTAYKLLNIDEKLVPNIMQEEKPNYVAPYENTNFTKKKKPVAIVTGVLALGAIAVISVFGALNKSPLNISNASSNTTQIYVAIKGDNPVVNNEDSFKNEVLANVLIDGKPISYSDVSLETREEYDYESSITTKYTYFVTSVDSTFNDSTTYALKDDETTYATVSEVLEAAVANLSEDVNNITVEEKVSHETVTAPDQGFVALAAAVSIVGSCLYFAFRYRPSRAIGALAVSSVTTLLTYGLLVATRIQTVGIASIVMPIATIISLFGAVLFFEKEKELLKDVKGEEDKNEEVMVKAASLTAAPLFIVSVMLAYIAINYFAFANGMPAIFAGMLIATVIAALLITTLLGPISTLFHKWLKKIKLPTIKINKAKKTRIKLQNKPKTSEPEETVFIGIND